MSQVSFLPERTFVLFDRQYRIAAVRRRDERSEVDVIDGDGVFTTKTLDYLIHQHGAGNLRAPTEDSDGRICRASATDKNNVLMLASDLPPEDFEVGKRNASLLQAVHSAGGFLRGNVAFWQSTYQQICAELGFDEPPHRTTVQRWIRKVTSSDGLPASIVLAPVNRLKGGPGKTRMALELVPLVDKCIEDVYLSNPNTSMRHCHLEIVKRIDEANRWLTVNERLKCPSYGQLLRHVEGMSAYEVCASRSGKVSADTEFRSTRYVVGRSTRALQRVEVDHTPLDIFLVDADGVILGRARLTMIIDVGTRAILGFNLGYDGNSSIAVLEALKHAVNPKSYLKERYPAIQNDWPMYGLFELLGMDNGSEFHKPSFKMTVQDLQIANEMVYMPRRKAYYKGTVEAVQKYLNRDMSDPEPGATESHHWQRNVERPPEQYAVHTLESATELIHIWICDIYHPRIHRRMKTSPLKAWKEKSELMPIRLPGNLALFELACTELVERTIQPYGIEVCELRTFNNKELDRLRRLYQHKKTVRVQVRFKPKKLDKIWVKDPDTQTWFEVENFDPLTRGSTAYQQQQVNKIMRKATQEESLNISLAEAYERLRKIGTDLSKAKTILQRRRALKMLGLLNDPDEVVHQDSVKKNVLSGPKENSATAEGVRGHTDVGTSIKPKQPVVPLLAPKILFTSFQRLTVMKGGSHVQG